MASKRLFQDHLPNPEERAFVYQKIQEIHDFAPRAGHMLVILQKTPDGKGPNRYAATLKFTEGLKGLEWRHEGEDFFATVTRIKNEALEYLDKWFSSTEANSDQYNEEAPEEIVVSDWQRRH